MKLTPKIQKAINIAAKLHLGETRKGSNEPYIVHPFSVAFILGNYTKDEDVIVAGLMHDTLEDVKGYKYKDLKKDFGRKVADIVREVSEDKDPGDSRSKNIRTWQRRKENYINNLKNDSQEALLVSCADKIHNLSSLLEVYREQGDKIWKHFNAPPEKIIWYNREVFKVIKKRLNNKIVKELEVLFETAAKIVC